MNNFSWIFTGLFIVSLTLYIIFYFNKKVILTKAFACAPIPIMAGTTVSVLINYIPDSIHIIFFLILSFVLCTTGKILQELSEKNLFLTIGKAMYGLSAGVFIFLFSSIFYLNHISQWFAIPAIAVSAAITAGLSLFIKHQKPVFYITCGFIELVLTHFSYVSLLTLIFDFRIYSILLFCGAIFSQIYTTFHLMDVKKLKLKHGKLIKQILLLVSQALVCSACVFIFI